MQLFMNKNFLLKSNTAQKLFHDFSSSLPIIDYHCHLSPQEIWDNAPYQNITKVWLAGDHYKWRAMRSNGISEEYITGNASDRDKFQAWAKTIPACIGNPLYHWTHLELQRYFNINEPLNSSSASTIWKQCNNLLQQEGFRPRDFMSKSKVQLVCTTDDPCDALKYHQKIKANKNIPCIVLPTFRPDKSFTIEHDGFISWIEKLSEIVGYNVDNLPKLKRALIDRMDFFELQRCKLSDHGMDEVHYEKTSNQEVEAIFSKRLQGNYISTLEVIQYKTAILCFLAEEYSKRNWTMQLHIGAQRNNNTRMFKQLGPDTGFDSISDVPIAKPLSRFLDYLDSRNILPKTILYTVDACKNDMLAAMIGNFQGDEIVGKIQFGTGWWFQDQRNGMESQMQSLANLGVLSHFIGMLTDSRSFLSYPRHEYFRRIFCNIIGSWVENGEYPYDEVMLKKIVEDISYYNAKNFFQFNL